MKIAFRLYKRGKLILDEAHDVTEDKWKDLAQQLGKEHAEEMFKHPHIVEVEFLDQPNPAFRFFRFGTDVERMKNPLRISLTPKIGHPRTEGAS